MISKEIIRTIVAAGVMARRSSAKDTGRVEGEGMFSRFGVLGFFLLGVMRQHAESFRSEEESH